MRAKFSAGAVSGDQGRTRQSADPDAAAQPRLALAGIPSRRWPAPDVGSPIAGSARDVRPDRTVYRWRVRLHSVAIRNYRGIRSLDWVVPPGLVCLIGPGNTTKSTLLAALDLIFSPRPSVSLCDADFYRCVVEEPLSIEVVVVDLPPVLENFETYGPFVCGVGADGAVVPDPADGTTRGLLMRFSCDASLEPVWEVAKPDGAAEPRRLTVGTRRMLPFFRVDDRSDQHLRWARGSHLERLADDTGGTRTALVDAHRLARRAIFDADLEDLRSTAREVAVGVTGMGGDAIADPGVGLDPAALASGASLVLHNGPIPFTSYGLGMRRLASLSVQRLERSGASVVAMDEIEHGLEPHRLIRLLHILRKEAQNGAQVLITTHSPVTVESLDAQMLAVVRSNDGETTVKGVPPILDGLTGEPQGMIRSGPSAMLARRVLVVEGSTEEGMLRSLSQAWDSGESNLAMSGVVVRSGENDKQALQRAECLARLGYEAAALIDNDTMLDPEVSSARAEGAVVFRWPKGRCLETQLAYDTPGGLLLELLELASDVGYSDPEMGKLAVLAAVSARVPGNPSLSWNDPSEWPIDLDAARTAIGETANAKKWFKGNPAGEALGRWLVKHLDDFRLEAHPPSHHLVQTLTAVKVYLYEGRAPGTGSDAGD